MSNSKSKITVKRTCPACEGRGKSYGRRHCGYCHGRHKITETVTIEHDDARADIADAVDTAVREVLGEP